MTRLFSRLRRRWRDRRGVAAIEFALMLPLLLALLLSGAEMGNFVMANVKTQRLATMTADMVAQSGISAVGASEPQIYDLFYALDVAAKPYNVRNRGRVIISAVKGVDSTPTNTDFNADRNSLMWQRFDGDYTSATILLGCWKANPVVVLPGNRKLVLNELMFHVQVSYRYEPLLTTQIFTLFSLPTVITRTATFHARSGDFQAPTPANGYPAKENCTTSDGL